MAKGNNQKLKILYIAKMLTEETDEENGLTMQEIISRLSSLDITADRKTIYSDIEELRKFGLDIIGEKDGKNYLYKMVSREFELPELKLLVDSVQAAKFITERKSRELIKKLESLSSIHEAKQLQRQVLISGRIKTMNESIYYNVDKLHIAINSDSEITFLYFNWNEKKEQELRRNGAEYRVSPWYLIWDDEYYYLVAYESLSGCLKHFRVDKMLKIKITDTVREGKDVIENSDIAEYSKSLFGMFGGEKTAVTIEAKNDHAGILIDRFGKDITLIPVGKDSFKTTVEVVPSNIFLSWIMSFGGNIKITGPESTLELLKKLLTELNGTYGV